MIYELSTVCIRDQKKLKQSEKVGSTMHKAAADMLLSPPAFFATEKVSFIAHRTDVAQFSVGFLDVGMFVSLHVCNVIWWLS